MLITQKLLTVVLPFAVRLVFAGLTVPRQKFRPKVLFFFQRSGGRQI